MRFTPRGRIQYTGPYLPQNAADIAFGIQQQAAFDECNKFVASVAFFRPDGTPDALKTDFVQTRLLGVDVRITASSLPIDVTTVGWLGQTDWTATLAARKTALATF